MYFFFCLQRECRNYIQVLQVADEERLYVCGTHAFQPQCDYLVGHRWSVLQCGLTVNNL